MNDLVSIVIPVYNSMQFLDSCISSVLSQTYNHIEVILIDDGSTDESPEICHKYECDERVKYYRQENSGANSARRNGVMLSTGKWVSFVDSDDLLMPNSIYTMLSVSHGSDIVVGCPKGGMNYFKHYPDVVGNDEYEQMVYARDVSVAPFAKLFREELFNGKTFDCPNDIVLGEDYLMNLQLALTNKNVVKFCKQEVYIRRYNPRSLIHTNRLNADYCELMCELADAAIGNKIKLPQFMKARVRQRLVFYYLLLRDVDYRVDSNHPFVKATHDIIVETGYGDLISIAMTSTSNRTTLKCLRLVERAMRRLKYPPLLLDDFYRIRQRIGMRCK